MSRTTARLPVAAAAIAAATVIAACGSSSSSSSSAGAQPGQAQIQKDQQDAVRFVGCMRSHGVPNLPDPTTSPRGFKDSLDPSAQHSPAFLAAVIACRHLLPKGGQPNQTPRRSHAQIAAMLAFARCIRSHGFPSFPDPTSNGEVSHEMLASAGIDVHQPAVLQAGYACTSVTHGIITRTDVARFVAGQ